MEQTDSNLPDHVEEPLSLLPDLSEYGIEAIDQGICEDTYENRKILRAHGLRWRDLYNNDGTPSDKLLVISPEMQEYKALEKSVIFENPTSASSDYLTGTDLLLTTNVEEFVPAWVIASTRQWVRVERQRDQTGKMVWPYLEQAPGRCTALKMNGQRCLNWHNGTATDGTLCRMHLGRHGTQQINTVDKARNRLKSAAVRAVDELESLIESATSEPVRLKAATELLDRVGVRAGIEVDQNVNIEVKPSRDMIEHRLQRLLEQKMSEPEPIEVEVVEDGDE